MYVCMRMCICMFAHNIFDLHMIATDRDTVELEHVLRSVCEYVLNNLHRRLGRINVCIAHLEDEKRVC